MEFQKRFKNTLSFNAIWLEYYETEQLIDQLIYFKNFQNLDEVYVNVNKM